MKYLDEVIRVSPEAVKGGELYRAAMRCADSGDFDEALHLSDKCLTYDFKLNIIFRDEIRIYIVAKMLEAQLFDQALNVTKEMNSIQHKSGAIFRIIKAHLQKEEMEQAYSLAGTIEDTLLRNEALAEISKHR